MRWRGCPAASSENGVGSAFGGGLSAQGVDPDVPAFEEAFVFGLRIIGPFSVEPFIGGQEWIQNGGGMERA